MSAQVIPLAESASGLLVQGIRAAAEHVGYCRGIGKSSPAVEVMLDRMIAACARGMPEREMIVRLVADMRDAIEIDTPTVAQPDSDWQRMVEEDTACT